VPQLVLVSAIDLSTVRPSSLDVQFVDFDGVRLHLSTPEKKSVILLSISIRCWGELAACGALDVLKREYGALLKSTPEPEYDVSLEIDLEQIPADEGQISYLTCIRA
jgi:actin related protein 2/3 complex, subunit 2